MEPKHPDVVVQLSGADGNAFVLIGKVRKALEEYGYESDDFVTEATAGNYDHLLQTCMKWVTVE